MNRRVKAICIVAHPDDESIWMGGTIMKNKNWDWTIFSLCRSSDSDRAPKFKKVCKRYNARAIISDLDDKKLAPLDISFVKNKISNKLPDKKYDYIFTHGKNGEYGHLRHKEIHRAVREMVKDGELECKKLYYFTYRLSSRSSHKHPNLKIPLPVKTANFSVILNSNELAEKRRIVSEVHGYPLDGFEVACCNEREAFLLA